MNLSKKFKELFDKAKSKGYGGSDDTLSELEDWLRIHHNLCTELFFSFFHKKWSINSYFIDIKKIKKVDRNVKMEYYFTRDEALKQALDEMLNLI